MLFDSKITSYTNPNNAQLKATYHEFPDYDQNFIKVAIDKKQRKLIESVYAKCAEYLDRDFYKVFYQKDKFIDRMWELSLCNFLLNNNYNLIERKNLDKKARSDFCIKINSRTVWIEAVCSDVDDKKIVPSNPKTGVCMNDINSLRHDTAPRITNSLANKLKQINNNINNTLDNDEKNIYMVALNTYKIDHASSNIRLLPHVLYGESLPRIYSDGSSAHTMREGKIMKSKESKEAVPIGIPIFRREEYAIISGIIHSNQNPIYINLSVDNIELFLNTKSKNSSFLKKFLKELPYQEQAPNSTNS